MCNILFHIYTMILAYSGCFLLKYIHYTGNLYKLYLS